MAASNPPIDRQTLILALVAILIAASAFLITRAASHDVIAQGVKVQLNAPLNETFAVLLTPRHVVVQQDLFAGNDSRNSAVGQMGVDLSYALALVGKNVTSVGVLEDGTFVGCKNVTVNGQVKLEERCRDPAIRITIGGYDGVKVNPAQIVIEGTPVFYADPANRAQIANLIASAAQNR